MNVDPILSDKKTFHGPVRQRVSTMSNIALHFSKWKSELPVDQLLIAPPGQCEPQGKYLWDFPKEA